MGLTSLRKCLFLMGTAGGGGCDQIYTVQKEEGYEGTGRGKEVLSYGLLLPIPFLEV